MPPDVYPLVDVHDIVRLVGPASFERARGYARSGAVHDVVWNAGSRVLTSVVDGSERYRSRIDLAPDRDGFQLPIGSTCTCPVGSGCKHVAATLLTTNGWHLAGLDGATVHPARRLATTPKAEEKPPQPAWRSALSALTEPAKRGEADGSGPGVIRSSRSQTTPMALQFELREEAPRTRERWRGPTTEPVTAATLAARPAARGVRRLGVRPVMLSRAGNWVRGNLTWNSLGYQTNQLALDGAQVSWFSQFGALHRAARGAYTGQDADWIYLDDFQSPLLWHLLVEAVPLGIDFVGGRRDAAIVVGERATLQLDASLEKATDAAADASNDLILRPTLVVDGRAYPADAAGSIGTHGLYAYSFAAHTTFTIAPTAEPLSSEQRRLLETGESLVVPGTDTDLFLTDFYPTLRRTVPLTSSDGTVSFPEITPPALVLTADFRPKHTLALDWHWEYAGSGAGTGSGTGAGSGSGSGSGSGEPGAARLPLEATDDDRDFRDAAAESETRRAAERLTGATTALHPSTVLRGLDAAEFADKTMPELARVRGIRIDIVGDQPDYRELTEAPKLTVKTVATEQRDWFDLGVLVSIEGREVPFGPLFAALSRGKTKLLLVDNSYLSLDQPVFEQLRRLIEESSTLSEWETTPRISRYQASLWADFEDLADETEQAQSWRTSVAGLLELTDVAPAALPVGLTATLRPYQHDGFGWLAFLWEHQLGGILADDMGLGKTLQALALVAHAAARTAASPFGADGTADAAGARRPFLVVAPTSVVSNWLTESARFAPDLTVRGVTATQSKSGLSLADATAGADIVVTSYALFRLDFEAYQAEEWGGLILDEAQFVKNHASKAHRCAVDLRAPFKLAVTGTPMENNLTELWSLFAIVAPGLFPSVRRFTEDYVRPIAAGGAGAAKRLDRLRRRIRPLMMRRTKELVAKDLPAKQEQVLQIELAPRHRKLYDTFLQRERQKLLGLIDDIDKNRFIVFRSLTLLRMLSLDASLVDEKYSDIPSTKLDALFEQLEDVVAEGHRALVFSQFTSFLKKATARLDEQGIDYCYLDGATLRRAEVIDRFKSGDAPVFLISLKAGGFGLNLTEADYVFLLDPWWNPATEAQAVDRTHRIGQTRNVMVYRMVATGTIEEKVMALKAKKAKLFTDVLDDDEAVFGGALTANDIRGLLEG